MMQSYQGTSYLFGGNAPYVEELYEAYLNDPTSVPENWRQYFDGVQNLPAVDGSTSKDIAHAPIVASFAQRARVAPIRHVEDSADSSMGRKRVAVQQLIATYRNVGTRWADLDPLKRTERPNIPELDPAYYGFTDADMDIVFNTSNTFFGKDKMKLRELLQNLRQTYCGTIGVEYMYITDQNIKKWWQEKLESIRSTPNFTAVKKTNILNRLTAAEGLERFLHTKYVGQKRFSLEGGESFIASMDEILDAAGLAGVQEIVIGMAHRGRLNVLVNTLGKVPKDLFAEFDHTAPEELPSGDVKYHQGFSSDISTAGGPVHLSLAFNPSHLEIVNPVVEGSVRARMDRRGDKNGAQVMPILVHGDAAIAGQGVVQETLALAEVRGYHTGGTVHIVINNQIGFTTSDPRDMRSTLYCTDIMKTIEAPILHVNGDDPEAVVLATQLAVEYRMKFKKDVGIDIICFRKLGHNEQDTPSMTQPLMYKTISQHPGTRKLYADKLETQGVIPPGGGDEMVKVYRAELDAGDKRTSDPVITNFKGKYAVDWTPFLNKKWTDNADTAIPLTEWKRLAEKITKAPEGFKVHPLVETVLKNRAAMGRGEVNVDWGMGEHMAFASLVASGYPIRLSGEDSGRGTFTHRHSVLHDQDREKWDIGTYIPLQHVADGQAPFEVIDSILSEEAVLGFEYGYASAEPNTLTIWEAQFGDFANGAQVVIDQFIASGEVKWGRVNGLVMMLPHGYEGQGPEHSSARLERFMQLCADINMQVVQPTTASQIFHLLRRQMIRSFRKPLIIMTPKSLLRNKDATSPISEFTKGEFHTVLGEQDTNVDPQKVTRLIMCSGKVYYDLVKAREAKKSKDTAIIRIEQLYPFPHKAFAAELKKYPNVVELVWTQDEPQNQGAWFFIQHNIHENMFEGQKLGYSGRPASASPACGYSHLHQDQQKSLVDGAFAKLKGFALIK
ncbi:2-oxoglutarate dehydrogenase subunit E1 [Polynucleobacter sp. SHI8]|uniref:2-oxoglutarate dehydrogenase E1 component n=1 Tax=unclassified Polynucleobacter TaxID=2640945 RepID=UPI0024908404|nr:MULTISPECIES: 2-oxoglutarate dehydrogenase E1 component [unclassified Polynucleobacter]BDW11549.1 2-oxoglutarate dehydrogenase subunit E1 [Polynucleobacter sp. SHI2]BDW13996.1 2-oxoglutarate dehydrogenase subunit E1 [Polynucleobacter sp. SHI8]